jgi:peptidyl-tRNA hydrolase
VLGVPSPIDQQKIAQAIDTIVLAVKDYIDYDFAHAMSRYNIRGEPD